MTEALLHVCAPRNAVHKGPLRTATHPNSTSTTYREIHLRVSLIPHFKIDRANHSGEFLVLMLPVTK